MVAMKNLRYVIGIDIGTTSTKAVLFTEKGDTVRAPCRGVSLVRIHSRRSGTKPSRNLLSSYQSRKESIDSSGIDPVQVTCLSFSAAMHSLIAVNAEGKALTRSITWADNRSAKWAEKIKQEQHGHEIYLRTGTPIHRCPRL
jgi:gluconokinase